MKICIEKCSSNKKNNVHDDHAHDDVKENKMKIKAGRYVIIYCIIDVVIVIEYHVCYLSIHKIYIYPSIYLPIYLSMTNLHMLIIYSSIHPSIYSSVYIYLSIHDEFII